jgi:phosphate transport system substrate-binding protein
VARDPWGLAVTAASAVERAKSLTLTDSCGFVLQPGSLAVKAEDYPLTQPFFVLTPQRRLPLIAREFLEFLDTPAAGPALAQSGLIDREVERTDLLTDGTRLANAIRAAGAEVPVGELQRLTQAMQGAERLSLTFRFEDGARTLDAASRDNLLDLVRLVDMGTFDGQELVFVGFSDGSGPAEANLALSRDRAEVLRQELAETLPDLQAGQVMLASEAFGEALPIACDKSAIGRGLNRRVELWVRPATGSPATGN